MVSRYLVIALAFGVALYRAWQGAWVESGGLFALGGGLVVLRLSATRPVIKPVAYACFVGTALAIGVVLFRRYQS